MNGGIKINTMDFPNVLYPLIMHTFNPQAKVDISFLLPTDYYQENQKPVFYSHY